MNLIHIDSQFEFLSNDEMPFHDEPEIKELFDVPTKKEAKAMKTSIWAVGGGKGGVGKSVVSTSLAITLSKAHKKVLLLDLDLGGSNLHSMLGLKPPPKTLSDFIENKVSKLNDVISPTGIPNIDLISGALDSIGIANLKHLQKIKLLNRLDHLEYDYIILDLGAGTTFNTLDFFLRSHLGIIVTSPEVTSIENAYRFIKSVYFRLLRNAESDLGIKQLIDSAMKERDERGIRMPSDLISEIKKRDSQKGKALEAALNEFRPKLIINSVRSLHDIDVGHAMKSVCLKYFGIELDYIGHIDYDINIWQAIKKRKPLLLDIPSIKLLNSFNSIMAKLMSDTQNAA